MNQKSVSTVQLRLPDPDDEPVVVVSNCEKGKTLAEEATNKSNGGVFRAKPRWRSGQFNRFGSAKRSVN